VRTGSVEVRPVALLHNAEASGDWVAVFVQLSHDLTHVKVHGKVLPDPVGGSSNVHVKFYLPDVGVGGAAWEAEWNGAAENAHYYCSQTDA